MVPIMSAALVQTTAARPSASTAVPTKLNAIQASRIRSTSTLPSVPSMCVAASLASAVPLRSSAAKKLSRDPPAALGLSQSSV